MDDCQCPYCGEEITVDECMDDDQTLEWECPSCEKTFLVTASVHITYEASCADGEHDTIPNGRHPGWVNCRRCDLFAQEDNEAVRGKDNATQKEITNEHQAQG